MGTNAHEHQEQALFCSGSLLPAHALKGHHLSPCGSGNCYCHFHYHPGCDWRWSDKIFFFPLFLPKHMEKILVLFLTTCLIFCTHFYQHQKHVFLNLEKNLTICERLFSIPIWMRSNFYHFKF